MLPSSVNCFWAWSPVLNSLSSWLCRLDGQHFDRLGSFLGQVGCSFTVQTLYTLHFCPSISTLPFVNQIKYFSLVNHHSAPKICSKWLPELALSSLVPVTTVSEQVLFQCFYLCHDQINLTHVYLYACLLHCKMYHSFIACDVLWFCNCSILITHEIHLQILQFKDHQSILLLESSNCSSEPQIC